MPISTMAAGQRDKHKGRGSHLRQRPHSLIKEKKGIWNSDEVAASFIQTLDCIRTWVKHFPDKAYKESFPLTLCISIISQAEETGWRQSWEAFGWIYSWKMEEVAFFKKKLLCSCKVDVLPTLSHHFSLSWFSIYFLCKLQFRKKSLSEPWFSRTQ